MALPGTRAFNLFEDDPSFNLGMTPEAFANLGLMSLPGAELTVANPAIVNSLIAQESAPATTAKDLFDYYATEFKPDQTALDFWNNKIDTLGYEGTLNEFLNPAQGAAAPRFAAMQADLDYQKIAKPTPVIPAADMKPEPREVVDANFQGDADVFSTAPPEEQKTIPTGPANVAARAMDQLTQQVQDLSTPKFEGKAYDPAAYDKIVRQLTAQQQALLTEKKFPYTSTFGGPTETIADLAKRLAAMGISDIREFGMKHELPVEKVYETIYQDEGPALTLDTGKYKTISGLKGYDAERNPIFDYRELTPEEVEKLRFDKSGFAFLPSGQIKREDLGNTPYATTKYYNTRTGEEIDTSKFGGKAESGLFASSGAGEGYTNYRVVYDEKGIPVFLPEKEMSGMKEFVAKDLPGILSVLKFIPGAQIPVTIAQAAAAAYMGAKPEDILKSVGTSLIAGNMDKLLPAALQQIGVLDKPVWDDYLGKFVGGTPTTDLGKIALKAGESGLASLVQGASLEDALKSAAIGGAGQGLSGLLPESKPGDINYTKLLTAAAPAIARGELTNADLFRIISAMAQPTKKRRPGTP